MVLAQMLLSEQQPFMDKLSVAFQNIHKEPDMHTALLGQDVPTLFKVAVPVFLTLQPHIHQLLKRLRIFLYFHPQFFVFLLLLLILGISARAWKHGDLENIRFFFQVGLDSSGFFFLQRDWLFCRWLLISLFLWLGLCLLLHTLLPDTINRS